MASGSRRGGIGGPNTSVTAKNEWPVNWQGDKPEQEAPRLRGKMRRPRDPRKLKTWAVRPPRRNPLYGGAAKPYKGKRTLMYEPEETEFEEEEEE